MSHKQDAITFLEMSDKIAAEGLKTHDQQDKLIALVGSLASVLTAQVYATLAISDAIDRAKLELEILGRRPGSM